MSAEATVGRITSVCMSPDHGYPTIPQDSVYVGPLGIEGDAHSGPMRESFRNPGTIKQNDRPISIVSREIYREINRTFGLSENMGILMNKLLLRDWEILVMLRLVQRL